MSIDKIESRFNIIKNSPKAVKKINFLEIQNRNATEDDLVI